MTSEDYIFTYCGKPHVASLEDDRIYEVDSRSTYVIHLKSGKGIFGKFEKFFYTAKSWKRKCYLDILID
jgi:hypothetical protein